MEAFISGGFALMCGIIGEVSTKPLGAARTKKLREAITKLRTRGPDSQGHWQTRTAFLGHARLAIIDTTARANQPFKRGNLLITFNGEIYNYKQLREELATQGHTFKTTSDTEVILAAYQAWGTKCVERFDGAWAFCIYNTTTNDAFLSRDPIGEKPLVYAKTKTGILFASEVPALLHVQKAEPNWHALANFNTYNTRHIPAPYTAFEGVYKVRPGYSLHVHNGIVREERYFILRAHRGTMHAVLKQTTAQTCESDVPIGVFLSGGVDSSLICAYLPSKKLETFSLGAHKDDPELRRARTVAKQLGLVNHEILFSSLPDPLTVLENTVTEFGEPILLYQIVYADVLLKAMKERGIIVALGGNGADELFYGYDGASSLRVLSGIHALWRATPLRWLPLPGAGKYLGLPAAQIKGAVYEKAMHKKAHVQKAYRASLYSDELKRIGEERGGTLLDIFQWQGLRLENEHSVTMVADIAGARNGMEVRSPFLNRRMLNFAASIPARKKVPSLLRKQFHKYPLKQLAQKLFGSEIAFARKMGFGYGVHWHEQLVAQRARLIRHLRHAQTLPVYERAAVQKFIDDLQNGRAVDERTLMEIVVVAAWHKRWCHA